MAIEIRKVRSGFELTTSLRVSRRRDEVFAFFADASNLERITPEFLGFRVLTATPIEIQEGAIIDYAFRIRRIPLRWQSEITAWAPPFRFVDEQRHGPYRRWVHEHRFIDLGEETIVEDRVGYSVRGGRLVHAVFVRRDLKTVFEHRAAVIRKIFA